MAPLSSNLLGSQKEFMWAKEQERVYMGGWRLGKTWCLCKAGLLLSHNIPDNFGFIGRAAGKDLHTTTVKTFFDEVCPPNYIVGKPKKVGQSGLLVTIKCDPIKYPGQTSQIYFDYILDRVTGRSHLAGGNWGWFGVDQVEEIGRADWVKLKGRLSRTTKDWSTGQRVPIKTHAMGVGNQMGHDWIFEDFFESGDYVFDIKNQPNVFYKAVRTTLNKLSGETHVTNRLGVIGRAEENAMSNGGYVPDEYYADQRRSNPPEFVARYMDGSFDDFTGKIYADYNLTSVHNIEPFPIPDHWPWGCCIDPGGSVPWGVGVWRMDEEGNKVLVDDAQQLYAARINPNHVVNWLRKHTPTDNCRYIVDYQNVPVMVIFQEAGIYCESAMKDVKIGLNGAINEMFVNPGVPLPRWYQSTQPKSRYEKFKDLGCPRVFAFNTCKCWMKEHDNYIWDPVKKNVPKGDQRDDHCFIAGTKIETITGPKNVEDVRPNDLVLTRAGYRPVNASGARLSELFELTLDNGTSLIGSPDHHIWTQRGWCPLDETRYSDILTTCELKPLPTTGLSGGDTQNPPEKASAIISKGTLDLGLLNTSITKSMRTISGLFRKAVKFITRMRTPATMHRVTLRPSPAGSIRKFTVSIPPRECWNTCRRFVLSLKSGTLRGLDLLGTLLTGRPLSPNVNGLPVNAIFAAKDSEHGSKPTVSVPITVNRLGAEDMPSMRLGESAKFVESGSNVTDIQANVPVLGTVGVSSLRKLSYSAPVYNISVVEHHEYFANGVLVSNCDETRYFLASKPTSATPLFIDPYREMRKFDVTSAQHNDKVGRELERFRRAQAREIQEIDPYGGSGDEKVEIITDFGI